MSVGVASRRRARSVTGVRLVLLVVGAAVMVTPFLYMVSTAFKPQQYVLELPPQFVPHPATTDNFVSVWESEDFARYFLNSTVVTLVATSASILLSTMMAYAFARFTFPGREWIFRFLLLGLMIPATILLLPQFLLAKQLGLLDSLQGLVVFYVGANLALNTFLLRGFFASIPREIEQAMIVDGANAWTRLWRLVVPLSRPALATVTIFTFLACWEEYAWALTSVNSPQNRTLPLAIALYQGENATQWGLVFAASLIAVAPVILLFLFLQRYFIQGLTTGAVKA